MEQVRFLAGEELREEDDGDDCSVLRLRLVAGEGRSEIGGETVENFYIAERTVVSK